MTSYRLEEAAAPIPARPRSGRVDVEIVGGGVTGCACALALAQGGLRVRLREARELASGASGRNGGFALRGGAIGYDVAVERFGREQAGAFWVWTERVLERLGALADDSGHGNVMGLGCGDLVARAILGTPPPELALFDPARLLQLDPL